MNSVLRVEDLRKSYRKGFIPKKTEVLRGVNFTLQPGAITGFLGGNGAGKTTTIKCILELAYADRGRVEFFGQSALSAEVKARIGFLPERPYFYEYLTGSEFLHFYGELSCRISRKELNDRIDKLLKRVNLSYAKDRLLRGYSKGMLQRIGIAQALIHHPEFVIFDEPMTGLDPDGRWEVTEIIRETAQSGCAVFFSSHLLNDAEKLCTHLVILSGGLVKFEGPIENLMSRSQTITTLQYANNGQLVLETISNNQALQDRIDQLRAKRLEIVDIRRERKGLEEVFREMAIESRPD